MDAVVFPTPAGPNSSRRRRSGASGGGVVPLRAMRSPCISRLRVPVHAMYQKLTGLSTLDNVVWRGIIGFMPINSRAKGARREREWARLVSNFGWPSIRTAQRSGKAGAADVDSEGLPIHWEVKGRERLDLEASLQQA